MAVSTPQHRPRRLLFLGEIGPGQTSRMRMAAFRRLGFEVEGVNTVAAWRRAGWLARRVQRRLEFGQAIAEVNRVAFEGARTFRPDIVWAEKQEFLRPDTLAELKRLGATLFHFTPDPYFSLSWKRTRLMDQAIQRFDVLVYCKAYEKGDYEATGVETVYMPLGYCDEVHRPLPSDDPHWTCSIGFLGGWEPRRERLLHAVATVRADVKIWGGYWDFLKDGRWTPRRHIVLRQLAGGDTFSFHQDRLLARAHQGGEVYADDYAMALTGSKIGLGFLRSVCADQHTTRTFEIPACGSMLLADRTEEHQEFFVEGKEAEFFESKEELLDKVKFYCANEYERKKIAELGHKRCVNSNYAYVHRLRLALDTVRKI